MLHIVTPFPNSWQSISCLPFFFFKFQIILLPHNKFFLSLVKTFLEKAKTHTHTKRLFLVTKKHKKKHNSHGFTVDNTKTCHLESQRLGFLFLGLQDSSRSSSIHFFLISLYFFNHCFKLFNLLYICIRRRWRWS